MNIVPFHVDHFERLQLQPAQHYCAPYLTRELAEWVAEIDAYTALVDDVPIAIAGLYLKWPGSAVAWSWLSAAAGPHMLALTRAAERFLELRAPRRTEAYVDIDFAPGHRWMAALGFEREGRLRANRPDGGDQILYARVRHV